VKSHKPSPKRTINAPMETRRLVTTEAERARIETDDCIWRKILVRSEE
jgi:hypothetical protein